MTLPRIVHLVDDTTPGGVMRLLDHIMTLPPILDSSQQSIQVVKRKAFSHGNIPADVIVSHLTISWRSLPALLALRAAHPNTRLIHVEHSYTQAFTALNVTARKRFFALLRVAYSLFDRVVAVSNEQGRWLADRNLVSGGSLQIIPNNLDLVRFASLPTTSRRPRVIAGIGRLDRQKGFDILIKAFRQCQDQNLQLRIFGEGPARQALKELAAGDRRIDFCGYTPDPVTAYAQIDALVMPSRWEAFGLVALEARAAGRPILVSNIDGLRSHIALGAIPVNSFEIELWTAKIAQLCDTEHDMEPLSNPELEAMTDRFVAQWRQALGIDLTLEPAMRSLKLQIQ